MYHGGNHGFKSRRRRYHFEEGGALRFHLDAGLFFRAESSNRENPSDRIGMQPYRSRNNVPAGISRGPILARALVWLEYTDPTEPRPHLAALVGVVRSGPAN
jgi:hypothetical protein